jgi:hypothetical protein
MHDREITYEHYEAAWRFCERRTPVRAAGDHHLEACVIGNVLTITEHVVPWARSGFAASFPIAQLRFEPESGQWTLYAGRRPDGWYAVPDVGSTADLESLLKVIDDDPADVFWSRNL